MLGTEEPWRNLNPTHLAFGERGGVFFQDTEAIPPILVVEVVPQAIAGLQGPREVWKGECALRRVLLEN